ncbi:MAG: phage protein GemA/Gp16 family protein [Cypionkella sp.]
MSHPQIKLIHVAARELGLDEDTRRELQLVTTGKASLRDMTAPELDEVVKALKARGFAPGRKAARKGRKAAPRGDIRFCHVLWGKLVNADAVEGTGAKGLNAFIRSRFEKAWGAVPLDVDQMQDWKQIATVIEALKAMCARAGVKL